MQRRELNDLLRLHDFPDPTTHSPARIPTTTPLQQLFVLNSAFIQKQAAVLADAVAAEPDDAARIRRLYRKILARDPRPAEMETARQYLASATMAQWAQVLLSTNEEIFWP